MKVILIAPFLLHRRVSLIEVIEGGGKWDIDAVPRSGLVIDRHTADGSIMRVERQRLTRSQSLADGTVAEFYLGTLSVATCVVTLDVADRADLHTREERLTDELGPLVAQMAHTFAGDLDDTNSTVRGDDPADLPHSRLLWWHRVLVDPDRADLPSALSLFGQDVTVSVDATATVSRGFSALYGGGPEEAETILSGLIAATEEWLRLDDVNRLLGKGLAIVGRATKQAALLDRYDHALDLSAEVAFDALVLDERRRLLERAALHVYLAAAQVWDLQRERDAMLSRSRSVHELIHLTSQRRAALDDGRRDRLLFAFTVITVLQALMAIADFAAAPRYQILDGVRAGVAGSALTASVLLVLWNSIQGRRGHD